ncbi:MAG: 5-formyltetrahydrofolate cyclo-ligase [Pseudomonadota bacterium]
MNDKPPPPPIATLSSNVIQDATVTDADRPRLRRRLRQQRRQLSKTQQRHAAHRLARLVWSSALFRRSRHIGFYLANDGELNLTPLLQHAWAMRKTCYLPVITPDRRLRFAPYHPGDKLAPNLFGIPEPAGAGLRSVDARLLDLLLLPLVGFDLQGNRLGMGGGFYDRSLAFLRHRRHWRKPRLLGIAHALQRVDTLAPQWWDVPLDGVATEQQLHLI